jgi:hypothetical protein
MSTGRSKPGGASEAKSRAFKYELAKLVAQLVVITLGGTAISYVFQSLGEERDARPAYTKEGIAEITSCLDKVKEMRKSGLEICNATEGYKLNSELTEDLQYVRARWAALDGWLTELEIRFERKYSIKRPMPRSLSPRSINQVQLRHLGKHPQSKVLGILISYAAGIGRRSKVEMSRSRAWSSSRHSVSTWRVEK